MCSNAVLLISDSVSGGKKRHTAENRQKKQTQVKKAEVEHVYMFIYSLFSMFRFILDDDNECTQLLNTT